MTLTTDRKKFVNAARNTPLDAISVKKKGATVMGSGMDEFGRLVDPYVGRGPAARERLMSTMLAHEGKVTVRGHGWRLGGREIPGEEFVWTGTSREFLETWIID